MKIAILLCLLCSMSAPSCAMVQKLSAKGGHVDFLAIGRPSFIKIHGVGSAPTGTLKINGDHVSGEFNFALDSLDTGISLRNKHMKDKYLQIQKYPDAKLVIQKVHSIAPGWSLAKPEINGAHFDGLLTLHGVTRPVHGKFSVNDDGTVHAKFSVKLSKYNIDLPSFAGVTVANNVKINVQIKKIVAL